MTSLHHLSSALLITLMCWGAALTAAEGPGIPALSFSGSDEFNTELVRIKAPNGFAHAKAAMIGGYFVVPCFDGGNGGIIDVYSLGGLDESDADTGLFLDPIRRVDDDGNASPGDGSIDEFDPGPREAHTFASFWQDGKRYVVMQASNGIDVWDMTDPSTLSRSSRVGNLDLGFNTKDYNGIWWIAVQAPYVYASELGGQMHIISVTDPTDPQLVDSLSASDLGMSSGSRVASAHAIGNLLVVANNADSSGKDQTGEKLTGSYAFVDISDPENPVERRTWNNQPIPYATLVNGGRLIIGGQGSRIDVFDITDPFSPFQNSFRKTASPGLNAKGPGGYVNCQDGFAFIGCEKEVVMIDAMSDNPTIVDRGTTSKGTSIDNNFGVPLGNLNFFSNDRTGSSDYSAIMVVNRNPDTNPPLVNMVNPVDGASDVKITARVGMTFTDELKDETLTESTILLRATSGGSPVGPALPCLYTHQTGIVTLSPLAALEQGTTYQIDVIAGGVEDASGNGTLAFSSQFTTEGEAPGDPPPVVTLDALTPQTGLTVGFSASVSGGTEPLSYSWDFGDGDNSSNQSPNHTFDSVGRYGVTVVVTDADGRVASDSATQLIYSQPTSTPAQSSSQLAFNGRNNNNGRLYVANPDANTVTVINTRDNVKIDEIAVGEQPQNVVLIGNDLWVTNAGDATLSVIDVDDDANTVSVTIPFAYGAQPQGIVSDGTTVYVALQAKGQVVRLTAASRSIETFIDVGPTPRALSLSGNGNRLLVTRFISSDDQAEVVEVETGSDSVTRTFAFPIDTTTPDSENNGQGVPNYLVGVTITPDGSAAYVPAKKDNIRRGSLLSGEDLDFDNTVRAVLGQLDLVANDISGLPVDFDNQDSPSAVTFNQRGDLLYLVFQGTNHVKVLDAYSLATLAAIDDVPLAPQGLSLGPNDDTLYVHGFMGRAVAAYDVSELQDVSGSSISESAVIATVSDELLTPDVLAGKQIFYDASTRQMNMDGYISCATCHLDGGHDGRVWDFTGRNEGLRRTTDLRGRSGVGHGPVHWSGNFDEIHDFEHDIRGPFAGQGFMDDSDFTANNRDEPLGGAKAGESTELDQLAAYVSSLTQVPPSPHRRDNGNLTAAGARGKDIFIAQQCVTCHSGPRLTDSALNVFHDVGTMTQPGSGQRLGGTLTGIDTPTLKGLWTTDRYLHDGSETDLLGVFQDDDPSPLAASHRSVLALSEAEQQDLFAYLVQIDESETPAYVATDGLLVIEAEAGVFQAPTGAGSNHTWVPVVDDQFENTGAIQALPNSGVVTKSSNIATNSPRADYRVQISEPGPYTLWVYGAGASGRDNSVHIGVNGVLPASFAGISLPKAGTVGWALSPYVVTLSAGEQTLNLWMREDGVVVDKILLTTSTSFTPTAGGPPESETDLGGGDGGNQAPIVQFLTPASGSTFSAGESVAVEVSASDDGSIDRVELTDNGNPVGIESGAPYQWTLSSLAVGPHTLEATAYDNEGASSSATITISVNETPSDQVPFGNGGLPWELSASATLRLEGENYDTGGEGVAYHDTTSGNANGEYRSDDVDIDDRGTEFVLFKTVTGEWLEYSINVVTAGTYTVTIGNSNNKSSDREIRFSAGSDTTGTVAIPPTGGWNNFAEVSTSIDLAAGQQVLRLEIEKGPVTIDYIDFTSAGGPVDEFVDASFDADSEGFVYIDDAFRGTSEPAYVDGAYEPGGGFAGGGLAVTLGGINGDDITNMSGGWQKDFTVSAPSDLMLTLRYRLDMSSSYESDEYIEVIAAIDGAENVLSSTSGGGTIPWTDVSIDIGTVSAGTHSLTLGGFNNLKTTANEEGTVRFDDVFIGPVGGG